MVIFSRKTKTFLFLILVAWLAWISHRFDFHPSARYGIASWYESPKEQSRYGSICASYDYPPGSYLKITNLANGRSIVCRVAEAGPNKKLSRLVDLSQAAFSRIADASAGLIWVRVIPVVKRP